MIAPHIRIHDVDEGGFAYLTAAASRRDLDRGPELHVLHESGTGVAVLHTRTGHLPVPATVEATPAAAARLRAEHGVDRVILFDADGYRGVAARERELSGPDVAQPSLFQGLADLFWDSPAVVADPPHQASAWPDLTRRLARLPDGHIVLVAEPEVHLVGAWRDGWLVEVTTLRDRPADVVLELRMTAGELQALLAAPDVAAALLTRPELT